MSAEDVELVQQCVSLDPRERTEGKGFEGLKADLYFWGQIEMVAEFCEVKLNKVSRVKDIEHEV